MWYDQSGRLCPPPSNEPSEAVLLQHTDMNVIREQECDYTFLTLNTADITIAATIASIICRYADSVVE